MTAVHAVLNGAHDQRLDPAAEAGVRQGLRLAYSAMREGLLPPGTRLDVMADGMTHDARHAEDLFRLLYTLDPRSISAARLRLQSGDIDLTRPLALAETVLRDGLKAAVGPGFDPDRWQAFEEELAASLANEILALEDRAHFHGAIAAVRGRAGTLVGWLHARPHLEREAFWLRLASYSGHRTHPATKMRLCLGATGHRQALDAGAVRAHAPEFGPVVALPVLAVRADHVTARAGLWHGPGRPGPAGYRAYVANALPDLGSAFAGALGADAGAYLPLPIHPLQEPEIRRRFASPIAAGAIRWLDGMALPYRPTLSFRTLTPLRGGHAPVIKTSLNIQMTSEVRTLAPARTFNAPAYSDALLDCLAGDDDLARRLRIVPEPASIYWGPEPDPSRADYTDSFHLSAVFKARPADALAADEMAVPLNGLFAVSPLTGERVVADFMREAGVRDPQSAVAYMEAYAGTVLRADLGMMLRHGVALESHQQNVDMVFGPDARPRALLYRDISDGIQIYAPLHRAMGGDLERRTHPAPKVLQNTLDGPLRQVTHTTLASHLIPLVHVIASTFSLRDDLLFARLRALMAARIDEDGTAALGGAEARETRARVAAALGQALLGEDLQVKCLLTMRALQTQRVRHTRVPNPLVAPGP